MAQKRVEISAQSDEIDYHANGPLVVPLEQLKESDRSSVGFKALRLGELLQHGFKVPSGFCIRTGAYTQFMRHNIPELLLEQVRAYSLNGRLEAAQLGAAEIVERMMLVPIPPSLLKDLRTVLAPAPLGSAWAVRSSSLDEDSKAHSYAGLYHTFLDVVGQTSLVETIKLCWASLWSAEAVAYRARIGTRQTPKMAVILQHMVAGELSGVLFTANPHSGSPTEICLNVTSGLNESVVSGKGTPDYYRLSKITGEMLEQRVQSTAAILPKKSLEKLLEIALNLERLYDRPQDIEWTIRDGEIFLLQTRPISRLPNYFPLPDSLPSGIELKLDFVGMFSPFGSSLEMEKNKVYCKARRRLAGIRADHIQFLINGYLYGYQVGGCPYAGLAWLAARPKLLWKFLRPRQSERYFVEKVQEPYLRRVEDLEVAAQEEKTVSGILALLERAIQNYYEFQRDSLYMAWLADNLSTQLRRFIRYLTTVKFNDAEIFKMLSGFESYTHLRERERGKLETMLRRDEQLRSFLERCTAEEFGRGVQERSLPPEFLERFESFSHHFEYVWTSNNPKDAGWKLDYRLFLESVRKGAEDINRTLPVNGQRELLLKKIRGEMNRGFLERTLPLRLLVLNFLIQHARRFLPYRENRNHLFYRGVMSIRRISLRLGETFMEHSELSGPEDIFFLTIEEVRSLGTWPGDHHAESLRALIAKRAQEYRANEFLSPPFTVLGKRETFLPRDPQPNGASILQGLACSTGVRAGTARVIFSKSQFHTVKPGNILVCPKARPFFSSLFGMAGGLITEEGGMLSHGAILAREYGIPAVLNVPSATSLIQSGDLVTVDGDRGEIIIHSSNGETSPYAK